MAEIRWTSEAERWLHEIHDYLIQKSPNVAENVTIGIYQKVQDLKQFPEIGHRYRTEPDGEIRILLYGHYRIAYIFQSGTTVVILGIFHGSLDIERYLK
jgi:plasmid stabilization system protein ParE